MDLKKQLALYQEKAEKCLKFVIEKYVKLNFELYDILGCNPTKLYTIQKAMDNYSNLIENTRDLVYEKKKRR